MATEQGITPKSTMQDVLEAYPSAQRALFAKYHIGGCHSCGYEPSDILETVASKHGITDVGEILAFLEEAESTDKRIQISVSEVATAMKNANPPRLIDVRMPSEREFANIPGSEPINEDLAADIMRWPKDTPVVFFCHTGQRSMDAASYFTGHGFMAMKSMTGGIDAWSVTVDPSIPRYELARDPNTGRGTIRNLREVVSQAKGCMT